MEYLAGTYEIIVVGAGHAGCEAALAAARMGCRTLLLTLNLDHVALMPCNPSVGGPAKGNLVREIDALGGVLGINTDKSLIQIRMLNTNKGPAVRALRAQVDKKTYQQEMTLTLGRQERLDIKQAEVERLLVQGGHVTGVVTRLGARFMARAVIITTGTYLCGRIIVGDVTYPGGPNGQFAVVGLAGALRDLGLELVRFKTGTPPRVDRRSLDFTQMSEQPGDTGPLTFSFWHRELERPNIPCWLTHTNERTHQIIRENLHRSPMYSGIIEGVGARYCPSIEDKVVRFADRQSHQVFIEWEGLGTYEMYVQGLSTSLPEDVQGAVMHTVKGMEHAVIVRPGYAIEYDCVVPTQLKLNLETKSIEGLFLAGQLNGTSGYEEAAAQGLMAGINAALKINDREPLILKRSQAYLGVLIDDLVTKGTNEPYRLMTSRAEYRLLLRQDNADLRLTEIGRSVGLVDDERYRIFQEKREQIQAEEARLEHTRINPATPGVQDFLATKGSSLLRGPVTLAELLSRPEINYQDLRELNPETPVLPEEVCEEVAIIVKYAGYLQRQEAQVHRFEQLEHRLLPSWLDYQRISGLSLEARQKLTAIRPASVGQALRISGVSPADVNVLLVYLEQRRRDKDREVGDRLG